MQLGGFDANTVEPNADFEPIPAGQYKAVFTESEEKPTKARTGSYLQLKAEIIEGEHKGRIVFERLNLNNPNETAVDIAKRTLSSICRAVGVMTPRDSSDLHDKPFLMKLAVTPAQGQYGPGNDIKSYEAASGGGAAPQAETGGGNKAPWMS